MLEPQTPRTSGQASGSSSTPPTAARLRPSQRRLLRLMHTHGYLIRECVYVSGYNARDFVTQRPDGGLVIAFVRNATGEQVGIRADSLAAHLAMGTLTREPYGRAANPNPSAMQVREEWVYRLTDDGRAVATREA